jgi:ribosomal protein S27AE
VTRPLHALREFFVGGNGRHRADRPAPHLSLDDLLGSWPQPDLQPVHGAVVVQAWDDCEPCGKATPGVLHKDGWTCGECLTTKDGAQ